MKKLIYAGLAALVVVFLVYTIATQKNKKDEQAPPPQQNQVQETNTQAMHTVM